MRQPDLIFTRKSKKPMTGTVIGFCFSAGEGSSCKTVRINAISGVREVRAVGQNNCGSHSSRNTDIQIDSAVRQKLAKLQNDPLSGAGTVIF